MIIAKQPSGIEAHAEATRRALPATLESSHHDASVRRAAFLLQHHADDPAVSQALDLLNGASLHFDVAKWHALEIAGSDVPAILARPMPERRVDVERREESERRSVEARRVPKLEEQVDALSDLLRMIYQDNGKQPPPLAYAKDIR